jgi:hypothetical protein
VAPPRKNDKCPDLGTEVLLLWMHRQAVSFAVDGLVKHTNQTEPLELRLE